MQFYTIGEAMNRGRILLYSIPEVSVESNLKFIRGESFAEDEHKVKIKEGAYWRDFNKHNYYGFAVSKRIYDLLTVNAITGITFTRLDVEDHPEQEYYTIQIVSNPVLEIPPKKDGRYIGLKLQMNDWDGSDFFLVKNGRGTTARIICTERVHVLLNKKKYTNIKLTPIEELELFC